VKKRKAETEVVHSCAFDQERMAALEAQVESLSDTCGQAISELSEELQKAQGMLKFCYAICQNPGIKDLADRSKVSAIGAFAKGGFGNRMGGASNSGGRGSGMGASSWRPTP
jgi:hypothetical protein